MRPRQSALVLLVIAAAALAGCQTKPPVVIEKLPVLSMNSCPPARPIEPPRRAEALPARPRTGGEFGWTPPTVARSWRWIVIHHSASDSGSAETFDRWHRARGWDELGYHFVITNGRGGPDGLVQVGSRWTKQKQGAHTGGTPDNAYNECGIGICLVGDFSSSMPTGAQLAALDRLVTFLAARYDIDPSSHIIGHRDAPHATTECPGNTMESYLGRTIRPRLFQQLAARH